jgi:hypothetical protein
LRPLDEGTFVPGETAAFQEFCGKWQTDLLPHFPWRSFRRSDESAMQRSGISLKAHHAEFGHSNSNMTLVYAETDEAATRQAVEELGRLIFPKLSQFATAIAIGSVN